MAFEGLSEKLSKVFKKLSNRGMLRESDVKEAMREVRLALLEADVNFKIAKEFVAKVSEKAVGEEVLRSLTPGQQVVKIVHEELTSMMGGENAKLAVASKPPTIIVLCGLQRCVYETGIRPGPSFLLNLELVDAYVSKRIRAAAGKAGIPFFRCGDPEAGIDPQQL